MLVKKIVAVCSLVFSLVIAVPAVANIETENGSSFSSEEIASIVNINTADESTLSTLKGIGPAKAKAIVEYRKTNGEFVTVEDLAKVKGIGPKILEANMGRIAVSG